ncbi:helix-turn-helix domain-containing protein [Terriglobus aquaticus]|uniref:Helix-turn-helix domain-containing protein n=1 Tax=Terriglobus aquaticus TaxID=940139 RepID=A0ABW9KLQ0_9BACT|nr:helix-turn-helix domain-containing protein [Terriglobus aquaticus]
MGFGEGLRSAREERGIALDDISVGTRVSLRNLSALENERFRELPGGIFNRGIVRSYARYVGLDEDATITAFLDALRRHGVDPEHENENWAEFAENVKRSRSERFEGRRARWAGVIAMVFVLVLLALGVTALLARRGIVHLPPRLASRLHLVPRHPASSSGAPAASQPDPDQPDTHQQ